MWHVGNDKVAYATAIQIGNIVMSVAQFGLEGEKEGRFGEGQRATVCEQPVDFGRLVTLLACANEGGDFFNCVMHRRYAFLIGGKSTKKVWD